MATEQDRTSKPRVGILGVGLMGSAMGAVTMLPTAEIVAAVVEPLLEDWPEGTTWLQMSSVGAAEADRLNELAGEHDVTLVDAPVSGSTHPARQGLLTILAAAAAETMRLCEAMGLDQGSFAELLDGGALGSPYVVEKLGEMRRHDYPAGFPVRLALKDLGLVVEVQEGSGVEMPLLGAALGRYQAAAAPHGEEDAAAVYEVGS